MSLDGSTRIPTTLLVAALGVAVVGGCWNAVEVHCPRCAIVSERAPVLPPIVPETTAVVILVHGAFGFGEEWRAVVDAVRARPHTVMAAFAWGGPWTRKPSLAAVALGRIVQAAIDEAPPHAKILVIAHSAGGALTSYVGEHLRTRLGQPVEILSIAAPEGMNLSPYAPEREVDTPLGFAVGGKQAPLGPMATGVEYVEYATADPPQHPPPPRAGVRRVYLGARVGHNESVRLAALPVVNAL
ncbi:MAG TPA: alpha/beta fold hydrolase [Polyangia bacterium]|jgi:hypothetical protein